MKIKNLRKESKANRVRIVAKVIWENSDRPSEDVYFETNAELEEDLFLNPNFFLLACALPAMRYGEKRITLDVPICSEIKDGLTNAMKCLINWHGGERQVIPIEAPTHLGVLFSNKPNRAAGFFSGGIDALAMVRDNHLNFPIKHPRHIQDGFLVYGILAGENTSDPNFKNVVEAVSAMAEDAGIELIEVSSNAYAHFRDLDPDFTFWRLEYIGSFLAAIAHAFAPRFTVASIASTHDYANLGAWGSHPLLDPLYSSTGLQIRHENTALSRLEKTKLVGEWNVALKHLRVCNEKASYSQGNYNCGECGKCVKTMCAFLSLGLLEQIPTFVAKDVSKQLLIDNCYLMDAYDESCYRELIQPLTDIGRYDLVAGINLIIKRYHEQDMVGIVKRIDRTLFNGNLLNIGKKSRDFQSYV